MSTSTTCLAQSNVDAAVPALGVCIILLKGQKEDGLVWNKKVIEASRLAPTLWPILFAAILGNSIRALARWKAERGARLGLLEHLMGSQTVVGVFRSAIRLRTIGIYTVVLILLWALSPLGSQAVLRSLYLKDQPFTSNQSLSYYNYSIGFDTGNTVLVGVPSYLSSAAIVNTLYGSSLFSRDAGLQYTDVKSQFADQNLIRGTTVDAWGNVRIPRLQSLAGYDPNHPEKWIEVPYQSNVVNYTSLLGVPVTGISEGFNTRPSSLQSGNFTFSIGANYHNFQVSQVLKRFYALLKLVQCTDWEKFLPKNATAWMSENYHKMATRYNASLDQAPYDQALAALFPWRDSTGMASTSKPGGFFLDTIDPLNTHLEPTKDNVPLRHIVFGSRGDSIISTTTCEATTMYVNANVTCESVGSASVPCAVQAVRLMPDADHPESTNLTGFEFSPSTIATYFPIAVNDPIRQHVATSSFTEMFIADPTAAVTTLIGTVELGEVPIELFEERFGLLFNTFWRATVVPMDILGGGVQNATLSPHGKLNITALFNSSEPPIYAINTTWIVIFFVANIVMVLAAALALLLKLTSRGPEVLGFVSSLLRDSPYYSADQPVSSTLDGGERARIMADQWVRLGDVRDGEEVGRIAFGSAVRSTPVRYGRLYE